MLELALLSVPIMLIAALIISVSMRYRLEMTKLEAGRESRALAELRQQIEQMRETGTQYDLALEQTLQRLESKIEQLEERIAQLEQQQTTQQLR
ncbi:MAG: hypothetical protein RMM08_05510 [Armatimonadota bacterium]|nr:hypothetical protein [bacterium]MDW8320799.1 hypothetical protein [Armatimonadota bacterium]